MQNLTEALTEVKPARIGYFTIRGSRERNPLGYRCVGVNLTVAVSVGAGGCAVGEREGVATGLGEGQVRDSIEQSVADSACWMLLNRETVSQSLQTWTIH